MFTKQKLIRFGVEKLAVCILSLCENRPDIHQQLEAIFADYDSVSKEVAKMREEIASIRESGCIRYGECDGMADQINEIRINIMKDILPKFPNHAIGLMLNLLDTHEDTIANADDSDGAIGDAFKQVCADLPKAYEHSTSSLEHIVKIVYDRFMDNGYGVYDNIFSDFKDVLGDNGLNLLKRKLNKSLTQDDDDDEKGKDQKDEDAQDDDDDVEDEQDDDDEDAQDDDDYDEDEQDDDDYDDDDYDEDEQDDDDEDEKEDDDEAFDTATIKIGLQIIADCQNNVDAYIEACSSTGKPSAHDHLEIAKRFIKHRRGREAIQWLDSMDKTRIWNTESRILKIQALVLCGSHKGAQTERLKWFEDTLSFKVYYEILKYAEADFIETFKKTAIQKALEFPDSRVALTFLKKIQEYKQAAKLVHQKIDTLDANSCTLRPIAEVLCKIDPLAATLLYRKMIESYLVDRHKSYREAGKDFAACHTLSSKINDWQNRQNHQLYFEEVSVQLKRKTSFWQEYTSLLNEQMENSD